MREMIISAQFPRWEKAKDPGDEFWCQSRKKHIIASATLKDVSLQLNGMLMMWKISVAGNARRCHPDRQNSSRFLIPVCQFSSPLTEILVEKTEPARCLIWTYRKFYNGSRGKARSRKPGSCKEALKVQMVSFFCFRDVKHIVVFTVTKP